MLARGKAFAGFARREKCGCLAGDAILPTFDGAPADSTLLMLAEASPDSSSGFALRLRNLKPDAPVEASLAGNGDGQAALDVAALEALSVDCEMELSAGPLPC